MHFVTFAIILVFVVLNLVFTAKSSNGAFPGTKNAPRAFFVFGDSLVDNGNNNFLMTPARADSPFHGIDYPSHLPTGRFSNGKNIADLIGEYIGVYQLLPYLDPELTGERLFNGANFASAGIGILNDTGIQFNDVIRMPSQLAYFENYKKLVASSIGEEETEKLVNKALVLVCCGANDFVNNYYLVPNSLRSLQYELTEYVQLLVTEYQKILMRLYKLGARKVLVAPTGPMGCAPSIIALHSEKGECAWELQQAADLFERKATAMTKLLNKKLGSDVFISIEAHQIFKDIINKPEAFGFEVANRACCGQGPYNGLGVCTTISNLCRNRDKYMFWDGYHPSERMNRLIVQEIFSGSKYVKPMNLSTLMEIEFIKV